MTMACAASVADYRLRAKGMIPQSDMPEVHHGKVTSRVLLVSHTLVALVKDNVKHLHRLRQRTAQTRWLLESRGYQHSVSSAELLCPHLQLATIGGVATGREVTTTLPGVARMRATGPHQMCSLRTHRLLRVQQYAHALQLRMLSRPSFTLGDHPFRQSLYVVLVDQSS